MGYVINEFISELIAIPFDGGTGQKNALAESAERCLMRYEQSLVPTYKLFCTTNIINQ